MGLSQEFIDLRADVDFLIEKLGMSRPAPDPEPSDEEKAKAEQEAATAEILAKAQAQVPPAPEPEPSDLPPATPAAVAHAEATGVDLAQVEGHGADGTILKADVMAAAESAS